MTSLDRLTALRSRFAGTIQDVCAGIVVILIVTVALLVLP